jgi:YD repeat-containing protein
VVVQDHRHTLSVSKEIYGNNHPVTYMNYIEYILRHTKQIVFKARFITCFCFVTLSVTNVIYAQSGTTTTDGTTPLALSPGAPDGSYALSGMDNVNLYNGNLNFRLLLLTVGGRGEARHAITLPIEQRWRVRHVYNETVEWDFPTSSSWDTRKVGYGPGILMARTASDKLCSVLPYGTYQYEHRLTRLTFVAPDGTEYELRDQQTNGQTLTANCSGSIGSRGTIFTAADGSAVTFVSDTTITDNFDQYPSGYLKFRNGLIYRIDSGSVSWMRDRNGNKISFSYGQYGVTLITDSLNRQVSISYADFSSVFYDQITFTGFGGAQRTITINYSNLSSTGVLISGAVQTYGQLFPELANSSTGTNYDPYVVSSVVLPNNQQYQFKYNVYGELSRVILPTGGKVEYDFAAGVTSCNADGVIVLSGVETYPEIYRRVIERRVYPDGSTLEGKTTYSRPESNCGSSNLGYVIADHLNASGGRLAQEKHYFYGQASNSLVPQDGFEYPSWTDGKEYKTEALDTDGATVLRRVEHTWQQGYMPGPSWNGTIPSNPRIADSTTIIEPAGANLVAKQSFTYDQCSGCSLYFNNQTDVYEYDLGNGLPGALKRQTHTDYVTASGYTDAQTGAHIRSLPSSSMVKDGSGNTVAHTDYFYDEYSFYPSSYGTVTSYADPGTSARGNPTTVRKYYNIGSSLYFDSHANYDQLGNITKTINIRNQATTISYSDSFSDNVNRNTYALPTQATSPIPSDGTLGSNQSFITSTKYDFATGHATQITDANSQTTTVDYTDALDRLKQVNAPDGGTTQYIYTDTPGSLSLQVLTRLNSSTSTNLQSYKFFDGLGRAVRTQTYAYSGTSATNDTCDGTNSYSTVDTQYDALGRAYKVSNPYCMSLNGSVNPSGNWTTTGYDALSRVSTVTTPDSA